MNPGIDRIPRSPLTTRLSGSARETECRIRNIFQWKQLRPPIPALILATAMIALCGSLVSVQNPGPAVSLVMDVQYYDAQDNYIEIPALAIPVYTQPTEGIAAIDQALDQLKQDYQPVLDGSSSSGTENHCLLYPTQTQRYWNLIFYRSSFSTDLNTGHITSLVYDKKTGQQVTLEDALNLAGQTEDRLCQALADQYDPALGQEIPGADLCIQNQIVEGFRMGADGQPIFYLTARVDDRDDRVSDFVSGADNLYIWSDGMFTLYDQYAVTDLAPLVPAEECVDLDPPLWRQWYFSGGEPEGGLSSVSGLELSDSNVCLYRDGYPNPIGPGNWYDLFRSAYDGEPAIQILAGWEPVYSEGSYWDRWSLDGLSALRYYAADQDTFTLNTLDVTRDDLYTPRGIRVGATRDQVLAAYPEALTGNYWDKYPDEPDMLSYIAWSNHDPSQVTDFSDLESPGFGPAILFFFDGGTLRQITLTNMFD